MARDPHTAVDGDPDGAPPMLRQPADAPAPLGHVGDLEPVQAFRRVWASQSAADRSASVGVRIRAWAGRVTGRADRHLLRNVAHATDAIAARCDLLTDRLASQEAITADLTHSFGEEIARLRAEVLHLQRVVVSLRDPPA
jgi:hypothetical protein